MSLKLPADVYSPDQLGIALWELSGLIAKLQDAAVRGAVVKEGAQQQDVHVSKFLLSILHSAGISPADRPALEQLQANLQQVRDQAPVAHMVLPALPNQTLKRQLVEWFRAQIHQQMMMTFAVRSDIGGGFIMRIGSRQYDYTFRTQLLANKQRIAEIFDSVRK